MNSEPVDIISSMKTDVLSKQDVHHLTTMPVSPLETTSMVPARDSNCVASSSDQSGPQNLAGNASISDSAYASGTRSNAPGSSGESTGKEQHIPGRGRVLPGTQLLVFENRIDQNAMKCFQEVRAQIQPLLAHENSVWTQNDSNPGIMTTRIFVLGKSETKAAPYLVVFCSPKLRRRVRNFMKSKRVKELYDPADQTLPRLQIKVIGHAPRMTSAVLNIDVCYNNTTTADQITLCGSAILLVDRSQGSTIVPKRKATFGGVIEAEFGDGRLIHYGMTAGHAVGNLLRVNIAEDYESGLTEQVPFARVIDNSSLPGVISGTAYPLHDWALFRMESAKPNVVWNLDCPEQAEKQPLVIAPRRTFRDELCEQVMMIGSHGVKRGRLSSFLGGILLGQSKTFVETYMLALNDGNEVCDGDSGAWVIQSSAPEVYGHVVATDLLGDAYVVPLVDTLAEIKDCLGAISVGLPNSQSVIRAEIDVANVPNNVITAISTKLQDNVHNGRRAFCEVDSGYNSVTAIDHITFSGASKSSTYNSNGSSSVRKGKGFEKRKTVASNNSVERAKFEVGTPLEDFDDNDEDRLSQNWTTFADNTAKSRSPEDLRSSKTHERVRRRRSKASVKSRTSRHSTAVDPGSKKPFTPSTQHSSPEAAIAAARAWNPEPAMARLGFRRERQSLDPYSKQWDPIFQTDRHFKQDESWVQQRRILGVTGDDFGIFFTDCEESVPSCKVKDVHEFCEGACLNDLKSGAGISGRQRGAWLDDRSRPTTNMSRQGAREYKNPLTPTALFELLKVSRFDLSDEPNVDRRLIYISNLNPYYILALTETAPFHQVQSLRDAIWKHIALQTSIQVRINHRGYPIFRLEISLPYFALRKSPPSGGVSWAASNGNLTRQWIDLSFLELQSSDSDRESNYGIHEAHISFALCGSDHQRWTAYAFVDTAFDDEDLRENMSSFEGFHEDPIASDPWIEANIPIWDPREYFLAIFEARIARVQKEWEHLVRIVERSIKEYRNRHSSTLSEHSGPIASRAEDVKKTYDWTRQIVELLNRLLDGLSETITAWEIFNAVDGDINYFSDIDFSSNSSRNRCCGSLHNIKETFEALESHKRALQVLGKSCHDSAQALQIRLTLEGSEATKSGTAMLNFTLFLLGPIALATAWFQLPQSILPFPQNPKSFVVVTIVIMIIIKSLHLISGVIPGFRWWRRTLIALIKTVKIEEVGNSFSISALSRLVLQRHRNHCDRNIGDVEMGPVHV